MPRLKSVKRRKCWISASPANWHVQTAKTANIPSLQYARDKDAHIKGVRDNMSDGTLKCNVKPSELTTGTARGDGLETWFWTIQDITRPF